MLCLSGFELYSRWVPLNYVKYMLWFNFILGYSLFPFVFGYSNV